MGPCPAHNFFSHPLSPAQYDPITGPSFCFSKTPNSFLPQPSCMDFPLQHVSSAGLQMSSSGLFFILQDIFLGKCSLTLWLTILSPSNLYVFVALIKIVFAPLPEYKLPLHSIHSFSPASHTVSTYNTIDTPRVLTKWMLILRRFSRHAPSHSAWQPWFWLGG